MKRGLVILLVVPALAGCFGGDGPGSLDSGSPDTLGWTPCEHPWPCADGSEWPTELEGPFDLASVERVRVESHDAIELDGWLLLPDLPNGVAAPSVLTTSPYLGQLDSTPPQRYERENDHLPWRALVESGYAVAAFSVRGTGHSGGCYDAYGPDEQMDQTVLVDWIADQPWSNGRVGVMGLSYMGTTASEAAVQSLDALKTVVMAAADTDVYLLYNTPQGAPFWFHASTPLWFTSSVSFLPPLYAGEEHALGGPLDVRVEHMCPETAQMAAEWTTAPFMDARPERLFEERRIIDRFGDITASVFLTYGFHDYQVEFQDDVLWPLMNVPKRQVVGDWGHDTPWRATGDDSSLMEWFDFWLKGIGGPPASLGTVEYQDTAGTWHNSTAWPPIENEQRVLYLDGDLLSAEPGGVGRTVHSAPSPSGRVYLDIFGETEDEDEAICLAQNGSPTTALYEGSPLEASTVLAGSAFGYLSLTSDQPGGLVSLQLYALSPDFSCDDGTPSGARRLGGGAADLEFHKGGYQADDFPTNTPTPVRIDISTMAAALEADDRLAVLIGRGGPLTYNSMPYMPTLTVHGDSHLVLPLLEGELGGPPTSIDYPPRPFVPEAEP